MKVVPPPRASEDESQPLSASAMNYVGLSYYPLIFKKWKLFPNV